MGKIIWAPSALEDIESIACFIERDSVDQAALFVARIIEMTDQLQEFPESGRIIPEINQKDCREMIYGAYRIMYRVVWGRNLDYRRCPRRPQLASGTMSNTFRQIFRLTTFVVVSFFLFSKEYDKDGKVISEKKMDMQ